MSIHPLQDSDTFILETRRTALVLGQDARGRLLELYRGPRLPRHDDYPQSENDTWVPRFLSGQEGRDNLNPLAYPARQGAFFREPCLDVCFADGTRDLHLALTGNQIDDRSLTLTLADPKGIVVELQFTLCEDLDLIEHRTRIINTGSATVSVRSALTAATHAPSETELELIHLSGQWLNEFNVNRQPITAGRKVLESRRGITSAQANPFWAITRPETSETHGELWFGQIACSGNWKITVERVPNGPTVVLAGRNDFDAVESLAAAASMDLPMVLTGYGQRGLGDMSRRLHRYQNTHVLPGSPAPRPVLYNSWEATLFDIDETRQRALADQAASIGVELFTVDDGWFGARRDDHAGLGDWWVASEVFPNGLKPLADHVRSLGMRFGLWFEPEMVNPDSDLYRKHPEWIYRFPDREPTQCRNQLVLNCARADVCDYLFEKIHAVVTEAGVSFIKWDMNRPITEAGWGDAPDGEPGRIWQDHALGVYALMDRLREATPGLEIESCASGGSRIDLGIMQHTEQVWTSDNTDAYDRLFIQHGYSLAYSPRAMMAWVTHLPNWATERNAPLRFRLHVAMAGGLGIGEALNNMSDADLQECAGWIRVYKQIRQTVQYGGLHRVLPPQPGQSSAVQYVAADAGESIVFTYWPLRRWGENARDIPLEGLAQDTLYFCERIEDPDTSFEDTNHQRELSGAAWMQRGLHLDLRGDYASAIYRLTPKS